MTKHGAIPLLLAAVLAGCERQAQELPFSLADEAAERTVSAQGGVISTAAGASISFPAGSLGEATAVTLTPVNAPVEALPSGAAAARGFRLDPAGRVLASRAGVEVKFDAAADAGRAWLASVVNVLPDGVEELGDTRVDLSTSLVGSHLGRLGTFTVVIPEADAVFHVGRSDDVAGFRASRAPLLSLAATGTDSVVARCGDPDHRCAGLSVEASPNLLDRVADAAVVFPRIDGALRVSGGSPDGRLALSAAFRAVLRSGRTAENVSVNAVVEPTPASRVEETATEITFTDMRFHVTGSADAGSATGNDHVADLVIPKTDAGASVTVTRTFDLEREDGSVEPADVSITFPVHIHQ